MGANPTSGDVFGSTNNRKTSFSLIFLILAAAGIYLPISVIRGTETLYGWDYMLQHSRRLSFAREGLGSASHTLPAWYSREMLGTPFSANIQNFPWIPSHLILLFFDPDVAYAPGVAISAVLAAIFTYLFCRRARLSHIAAVAAAWTFSCAGYFSSRILVGALTPLEVYPSLPLLLWLSDRAIDPQRARFQARDTVFLALAVTCFALAGNPQLSAYAVSATVLYLVWHCQGRHRVRLLAAVILGIGIAMAGIVPMLLLVQRSTRVLALGQSTTDVVLPYHRLLALVAPGIDGWPNGVGVPPGHPFTGLPNIFWDTFAYSGILPLVAGAGLILMSVARRRWPSPRWAYLIALAAVALLGALPLWEPLHRAFPGTIMRSPARLLYLYTFAISMAFGIGVDTLIRWQPFEIRGLGLIAGLGCILFHAWDLGHVARAFVVPTAWHALAIPEFERILAQDTGDHRVATSVVLSPRLVYNYDSAGGYDPIFLANTYRGIVALTGAPAGYNEEYMDAAAWSPSALRAAGVKFVVTWQTRTGLDLVSTTSGLRLYRVDDAASRAAFFAANEITFLARRELPSTLTMEQATASHRVVISEEDSNLVERSKSAAPSSSMGPRSIAYSRPNSDTILIRCGKGPAGVVYVLESYDPGWNVTVDGKSGRVLEANGLGMAMPVGSGDHLIVMTYRTPGRRLGVLVSMVSVCMLIALVAVPRRLRNSVG